jgi:hypothetical protein
MKGFQNESSQTSNLCLLLISKVSSHKSFKYGAIELTEEGFCPLIVVTSYQAESYFNCSEPHPKFGVGDSRAENQQCLPCHISGLCDNHQTAICR